MTNEQAIERLNFMIQQHICYEEVVLEDDNEDAQEELHETEVELEALRMAVRALESKPRWILCSARMPEMHEEEFLGDVFWNRIHSCSAAKRVFIADTEKLSRVSQGGRRRKALSATVLMRGCRSRKCTVGVSKSEKRHQCMGGL